MFGNTRAHYALRRYNHAAMDEDLDTLLLQTLQEFEWRLRRLEFVLHGDVKKADDDSKTTTVVTRLEKLERSLQKLSSESQVVSEVFQLRTSITPPLE